MKSFIFTIFLAILLVTGSILHMCRLKTSAEALIECNNTLITQLHKDDFKAAKNSIDELESRICDIEPFFASLGNHDEIDIIEQNIAELRSYTEGEQKYDAIAKAYVLLYQLEHLPKNLRLCFENIF